MVSTSHNTQCYRGSLLSAVDLVLIFEMGLLLNSSEAKKDSLVRWFDLEGLRQSQIVVLTFER